MKEHVVDLDAARAARREAEGEGPKVTFSGEVFTMPAEMPFEFVEAMDRLRLAQESDDGVAVASTFARMARVLFGSDYEKFLALRPTVKDVEALLEGIAVAYGTSLGESPASE